MLSKFNLLMKQLYKSKIKSKSFILMTCLYVLVMSVAVFWSEIKELFTGDDEAQQIAIINDTSADLSGIFVSNGDMAFIQDEKDIPALEKKVKDGKLDAIVTIKDQGGQLQAEIATFTPLKLNDQSTLSSLLQYAGQHYAVQQLSLSPEQAAQIMAAQTTISTKNLNEESTGGKSEEEKQSGLVVSYAVGILIYFFISTFLSMITTEIASEKGSRAMEMLLVSVKPTTHFKAKIAGVLLLALTQMGILAAVFLIYAKLVKGGIVWDMAADIVKELSVGYVIYAIVFLLLTVILYLIIGALFGSLVSKVEEAGQVLMPAMIITIIGFYVMLTGMGNPDTIIIKIFSYIPLTSGMIMPMRIGATDIGGIVPLLSLGILIATIIVVYLFSLSFYKRSVLTYSSGGVIQKIKTVLKVTT
ncbi:ABC transporter permease [Lysinibacillus sphaericus]|uniref:Sodium ABC transporter permease n=3 Tax=Lysinibacillus TaxID=400634 RepID=W7RQM8_LYSSH|nr:MULTISPECIES: ABC transporter permease [Lysinibacillus]MBE5082263.1 ABC transporter permease [Bacillus thuringiensis]EWH33882.1 sodium ABC transporter permease [Lysinibacillus sphaericus CBAM5]MBI6862241.1 ABC transporter permease [Lysinibacillus fusiformis]MCS1396721.1 ABC transporter permease [Lysinibacillus sp. PB211]MDR0157692.1 ABC transporter permease [Lysinibacillus sphaericus]